MHHNGDHAPSEPGPLLLTIGHSTRPLQDFIQLLQTHGVTGVVDVRSIPRSRHNPQFSLETFPRALAEAAIGYLHLPGLGGLRHPSPDSLNTGWRNPSFRGFADYMQTPDFEQALTQLIACAANDRVAIMCAEAVPWTCHRSLIADALLARGFRIEHIMSATHRQPHNFTPFAKVQGTSVTYPPASAAVNQKQSHRRPPAPEHLMPIDRGPHPHHLSQLRRKPVSLRSKSPTH